MADISPHYLIVEHAITYTNREPLPVRDVIDALKGLQEISTRFLPRALATLSHEEIIGAELYVEGFEEGSFITQAMTKLFFRSEEDVLAFLTAVREGKFRDAMKIAYDAAPGGDKPVGKLIAVSVVLAALVGMGAYYAAHNDSQARVHIEANNNTVIAIGAEAYKVDPKTFAAIMDAIVGPEKKKLAQSAARVIAPAKNDPQASVQIDGAEGLVFNHETVKATPRAPDFGKAEFEQRYPDVDLQIRATDRDSHKRGWAGVIPGLVDHRVKLILADGIPADSLADKFSVRADVTVQYNKPASTGVQKATAIVVERIIHEDEP